MVTYIFFQNCGALEISQYSLVYSSCALYVLVSCKQKQMTYSTQRFWRPSQRVWEPTVYTHMQEERGGKRGTPPFSSPIPNSPSLHLTSATSLTGESNSWEPFVGFASQNNLDAGIKEHHSGLFSCLFLFSPTSFAGIPYRQKKVLSHSCVCFHQEKKHKIATCKGITQLGLTQNQQTGIRYLRKVQRSVGPEPYLLLFPA